MKKKALIVIGDKKINRIRTNRSFANFVKYAQSLTTGRVEFKTIDYAQLLCGQVPQVEASLIKVAFFFPYQYWNQNIEIYQDGCVYGEKRFGRAFRSFFKKVKWAMEKYYQGKMVEYLNTPEVCSLDRDKQATKDLLQKREVPTPRTLKVRSFASIQRLADQGLKLYIKPRFGAMGKGITYVDKEKVLSNFIFRKGKIVSRPYDYNWRFIRIKDAKYFIDKLLNKGFICEEAIEPAIFKRRRFDFRVYILFGKVVYQYVKSASVRSCVTNWSQGGKIDKKKIIFNSLPKKKIAHLGKLAQRAAAALGLNFAGIDVIFSKDLQNAYVLEGNAFPGYEKGFDLMKCLLKHMLK